MLTKEEVQKIAKLAKLSFSDSELEVFTTQMGNILTFVEQLKEVDTEGVEETSQVTGLTNAFEEDTIEPCDHTSELLECSPHTIEQHSIKIPKMM